MTRSKYDVVLFGATGFTGNLVAEYLVQKQKVTPFRWALAGRSREKLEAAREKLGAAHVDIIVADAADEASLRQMARSAKVVLTTVGPYLHHGEPLVKACVEEQTHYVDLTGEPLFVERMIQRYHERAKSQRVKIVHACGFDSIPHDMGVYFAVQQLKAQLGSLSKVSIKGFVEGRGSFSGGTWHSALGMLAELRRKEPYAALKPKQISDGRRVSPVKAGFHREPALKAWALPLPTIDPDVVRRTALFDATYGEDFEYGHYIKLPNLAAALFAAAGISMLVALAQFRLTRSLLLKLVPQGEGPSEEVRKQGWFKVTFLVEADGQRFRYRASGGDPGYGDTSKMIAESALCLALDANLPEVFGIVTTATALGDALLERLRAAGMGFEMLSGSSEVTAAAPARQSSQSAASKHL